MSHGITEKDSMFSVRETPWHRLGTVLETAPVDVDDALEKSGLGWKVTQGDLTVSYESPVSDSPLALPFNVVPAKGWKANVREDTGDVLGIVTSDYSVVDNHEAFAWLEALLGEQLEWETAGSLHAGKRVWVLAKIPEGVEVGGDAIERYIYCANSHDGSMAVTAAATNVRVVCANTLNWALRSNDAQRTYKFRHTGNMTAKLDEARQVMEVARNWDKAFAELGNELARTPLSLDQFDVKVITPLLGLDDETLEERPQALRNREEARESLVDIFRGHGPDGDTTGNSPGSKWTAANAVAEYADYGRRVTKKTNQIHRSFEDTSLKQRGLELVVAA
jgi:phage/plasmid-like protein (TIGR03299 family)